ncbi:MAG: hypothetical protein PWQ30_1549 [Euryarchaeota archaeon]|jgi:hypothetical protein|nr:hypothetical protein [Euryarchaeota archaeon]
MIPQSREKGNLSDNPDRRGTADRAGARTAGTGEHTIHHVDCINVTQHRKRPGADRHTSLEHSYRHGGTRRRGGRHNRPGTRRRHRMVITHPTIPLFLRSPQSVKNQESNIYLPSEQKNR